MFNAAAALPAALRDRLGELAIRATGHAVPVTGSWGATETGPAVTTAHFAFTDARGIGAPLPGTLVKLVPAEEAYEIRVKGPMVTPGYYGRPDLTAAAFDAEGFYRSGDAAALADPDDPDAGLVFRGRLAEDFKLTSGTFVRVGAVRTALLSAAPLLSDAVIAGEDRSFACALAWLNQAQVAGLAAGQVRRALAAALAGHNRRGRVRGPDRAADPAGRAGRPGRGRDHRQGVRQPAAGAAPAGRPGRAAVRRPAAGRGHRGRGPHPKMLRSLDENTSLT